MPKQASEYEILLKSITLYSTYFVKITVFIMTSDLNVSCTLDTEIMVILLSSSLPSVHYTPLFELILICVVLNCIQGHSQEPS